jgi:hypothetical protein
MDIIVLRGVVEDSSSIPSNIETQAFKSDIISGTERKLESESRALSLVMWAQGYGMDSD